MACSTGCPTKDHKTYGECMRSKNSRVAYANSANGQDYTAQKKWDSDIQAYRDARAQGIQPVSSKRKDIDAAVAISNEYGKAFQG